MNRDALASIEAKHVYCDEKSKERQTSVIKRKYKVAGFWSDLLQETGKRLFFIGTSKEDRIPARETIEISYKDYASTVPNYGPASPNKTGKYSLRKNELLSREEIEYKINDPNNGFKDVAVLTDEAFTRFSDNVGTLRLRAGETSSDLQCILESVIDPINIAKRLEEMHIRRN